MLTHVDNGAAAASDCVGGLSKEAAEAKESSCYIHSSVTATRRWLPLCLLQWCYASMWCLTVNGARLPSQTSDDDGGGGEEGEALTATIRINDHDAEVLGERHGVSMVVLKAVKMYNTGKVSRVRPTTHWLQATTLCLALLVTLPPLPPHPWLGRKRQRL